MATLTLRSLAVQDVQAAIDQAAAGDTIFLPEGKAVWTSGVTLTKSLTISGAGSEATVLERDDQSDPSYRGPFFTLGPLEDDSPLRLADIGFDNRVLWPSYDTVCVRVEGTKGKSFGLTRIRIDHCSFHGGKRQLWIDAWVEGVADHCNFRNARESALHVRGEGYPALNRKVGAIYGNLHAWYLEDCTLENDDNLTDFLGLFDADYSGSCVWRRCAIQVAHSSGAGIWNPHGNHSLWNPQNENYYTGICRLEIYDCQISLPTAYRFGYCRGGRILMTDNQFFTFDGSSPPILGITEEEGWAIEMFDPLRSSWPGEENINSSFFWANSCNDEPAKAPKGWNAADVTFLQPNRDYWLKAPDSATLTEYPELDPPSRPDCPYQLGSSYWPPTTSFLKAPYPHPLVNDQSAPEPPPNASYSDWYNRLAQWIEANPPTPNATKR